MKRMMLVAMLMIALAWAAPAPAQLIFKKPKVDPAKRVPELIMTVRTDPDERKRAKAADELREYDTKSFPDIVPVLADVLLRDKKHAVRLEALTSLSKIRPISQTAGQAMEKAAANDDVLRVRVQAKASLAKYYLAGYSSKKAVEDAPPPRVGSDFPRPMPQGPPVAPGGQGPSLFPRE